MLLVKTTLKLSPINGIGLFANQFIPKGTNVWVFCKGFDQKIDIKEVEHLSEFSYSQFEKYAYLSRKSNKFILCFDDARFFNHSRNPNVSCIFENISEEEDICYAIKDIAVGEELTCDYRDFDAGPLEEFI